MCRTSEASIAAIVDIRKMEFIYNVQLRLSGSTCLLFAAWTILITVIDVDVTPIVC